MQLNISFSKTNSIRYEKDIVYIKTNSINNINELLSDKKSLQKNINYYEDFITKSEDYNALYILNSLDNYLKKPLTINNFTSITFETNKINNIVSNDDILKSINCPIYFILKDKNPDENALDCLLNIIFNNKALIIDEYNTVDKNISINDYVTGRKAIIKIVKKIESYNLSKLEQLMFVYDLLKDKVFEDNENDLSSVRDLNKVLTNDKAVCLGFANMFSIICNYLSIDNEKKYYDSNNKEGHVTNICYINDDKYDYNGCLEFDLTGDSVKNKDIDNTDKYNWYGVSINYSEKVKKANNYYVKVENNKRKTMISLIDEKYNEYIKNNNSNISLLHFLPIILSFYNRINNDKQKELITSYYNNLLCVKKNDIDLLMNNYNEYKNNGLPRDVFTEVLCNIRKIEHNINPSKYSMDKYSLAGIIENKYNSKDYELMVKLFGKELANKRLANNIFSKESKISRK